MIRQLFLFLLAKVALTRGFLFIPGGGGDFLNIREHLTQGWKLNRIRRNIFEEEKENAFSLAVGRNNHVFSPSTFVSKYRKC